MSGPGTGIRGGAGQDGTLEPSQARGQSLNHSAWNHCKPSRTSIHSFAYLSCKLCQAMNWAQKPRRHSPSKHIQSSRGERHGNINGNSRPQFPLL